MQPSRRHRVPEPQPPLRRGRPRVLLRVLLLNLGVAVAKIAFGYASGAISILSDGFHSLTDAASNVVGLVGVRAARQPPDEDHPYGHRKYETVAAAAVTVFLLLLVLEVLRNAFNHLTGRDRAARDLDRRASSSWSSRSAINLVVVALRVARRRSGSAARCCWPTRCRRAATSGRR